MLLNKRLAPYFVLLVVSSFLLSGCFAKTEISESGPELDARKNEKPAIIKEDGQAGKASIFETNIEVQASEERLDRSNPKWLKEYCVDRILEMGILPGIYERQRGPFIGLEPVYLSERHVGYREKATCSTDFYIWSVRDEAFSSMGIDYAYALPVWERYYDALTASKSATLKAEGWKDMTREGEVGVKPDFSMEYFNATEGLREYLDVFYTNDEEVVYELLIVNTGGR